MSETPSGMAFAIIRVDEFQDRDEARFTIKELVRTEQEAIAEVARLMELNQDKGARYFWQATRIREHQQ